MVPPSLSPVSLAGGDNDSTSRAAGSRALASAASAAAEATGGGGSISVPEEEETAVAAQELRGVAPVSRRSHRMTLAQSLKSLRSAFSSHSSRLHQEARADKLRVKMATGQGLHLSPSLLPVQRDYRDPKRTRLVKWINYRVRMEAFFAFYCIWCVYRVLVLCCLGVVVFMSLGVSLLVLNDTQIECKLNYEEYSLGDGGTRYECLPITADLCSPGRDVHVLDSSEILVYYELENFHQNGGQVIWSRSDRQLAGEILTEASEVKECEPFATKVVDNVTKVLHPCGALAWRVFTDSFLFFADPPDGVGGQGRVKPLSLSQAPADILSPHRSTRLYRNPSAAAREAARDKVYFWMSVEDNDDGREGRGKPEEGLAWAIHEALNYEEAGPMVENSHFIQWMETAALPTFRKLYGRLQGPLKLPLYAYISINYDVKPWGGRKALVLTVPAGLHGKTLYLGIAYLVFGCLLLLFALYLLWRQHLSKQEGSSGDIRWRSILSRKRKAS